MRVGTSGRLDGPIGRILVATFVLVVALAAGCSANDKEGIAASSADSPVEQSADPAVTSAADDTSDTQDEAADVTSDSEEETSDDTSDGGDGLESARVPDETAAGDLAVSYYDEYEDFIFTGVLGDGLSIDQLETVVGHYDPAALIVDLGVHYECNKELIAAERADLPTGTRRNFERVVEVGAVDEVRLGLWIVTVDRTLIIDGGDDDFTQFHVYVSDGGVFDLQPVVETPDDDDDCANDGLSYTDLGNGLLAEAGLPAP